MLWALPNTPAEKAAVLAVMAVVTGAAIPAIIIAIIIAIITATITAVIIAATIAVILVPTPPARILAAEIPLYRQTMQTLSPSKT